MRVDRRPRNRLAWWTALVPALTAVVGCGATPAGSPPEGPVFDQALHDRLPADVRESGVITVATDASYAPASFFAPDGRTIVGFEPDLGAAIGEVLGVELQFIVTDFGQILDDVESHHVDVAMSAVTDTLERESQVDFINYFSAGTSIVVQRGNPNGITDLAHLCGEVVAVEEGTVQVDLLDRSQSRCPGEPIEVQAHQTNDDALVELRTGRAAAVLNDYPPAAYLSTDARTSADYQLASDTQYEPGLYGIAVAADRSQLRDPLQAALERLLTSGSYKDVLTEWDVTQGAVDHVSVNAGRN